MKTFRIFKLITLVIIVHFIITTKVAGQYLMESSNTLTLTVKTYDGLELPAQVIKNNRHDKKMILFINGSTPYDEKGNLGAFWNDKGNSTTKSYRFSSRYKILY